MHRPNVVMVVADDHAPAAIGTYGAQHNRTPHLDTLAAEGLRLDNCFCTNAICTPARASIMTGRYSHSTGIKTLSDVINHERESTLGMWLQQAGYQTAMLGKWHLGHGGTSDPKGFDYWNVLPGQGRYWNPETLEMGQRRHYQGYVTDLLTDLALDWLKQRDGNQPFFLYLGHKAPHDNFQPHPRHLNRYTEPIPEPLTLRDDYAERAPAAAMSHARIASMHERHHLPVSAPGTLPEQERLAWNYQAYIQNYYRCVDAVDENVGRLLHYLDQAGRRDDTIVIYTSDHGFFLGDHGWYDKRFMYEESIRIPFLMRYPRGIQPGTSSERIILNVDFASTLLELAGCALPPTLEGTSFAAITRGETPPTWRTSMYYRYWMHRAHFNIPAHYGVRTERHKLIHYYGRDLGASGALVGDTPPAWELFDLAQDPQELHNRYDVPVYAEVQRNLHTELDSLQKALGDVPQH